MMHDSIVTFELDPVLGSHVAWKDVADTFQAFMAGAAIVVGGVFTYYKFFKDRVYRPRVNVSVEGGHIDIGHEHFLMCRVTMTNKGANKLTIVREGTAAWLFEGSPGEPFHSTDWGDHEVIVRMFQRHGWFESGETIADEQVIAVPQGDVAVYRLRFRLVIADPTPWWSKVDAPVLTGQTDEESYKPGIEINAVTTVFPTQRWKTEAPAGGTDTNAT
jgi:hypothetical protein